LGKSVVCTPPAPLLLAVPNDTNECSNTSAAVLDVTPRRRDASPDTSNATSIDKGWKVVVWKGWKVEKTPSLSSLILMC